MVELPLHLPSSYEDIELPEALIERVPSLTVILKPNISTKAPGSYTNPSLVRAVAEYFRRRGRTVIIAEGMHLRKYKDVVLETTGYRQLIEDYPFVDLEKEPCTLVQAQSSLIERIAVPSILLDEDTRIVNLPKLKTHLMTLMTGPVKNISMGIVNQTSRAQMHRVAGRDRDTLAKVLIDTYETLESMVGVTIVDAVEIMVGNGPSAGSTLKLGYLFIGDAIDLEWVCSEMLSLKGYPVLEELERRGRTRRIPIELEKMEASIPDTYGKGIRSLVNKAFNLEFWSAVVSGRRTIESDWYSVEKDSSLCTSCGECIAHCPLGAIGRDFEIDDKKCSRCLCCVENCPSNAINIKTSRIMSLLDWLGSKFYT